MAHSELSVYQILTFQNKFVAIVPGSLVLDHLTSASLQAFNSSSKAVADLVWTTTGGNLSQSTDGVIRYTAPNEAGDYQVRASLRDDPNVFDEINIAVTAPPPPPPPKSAIDVSLNNQNADNLNLCGFIPRSLLRSFRTGFTLVHEQIHS